VKSDPLGWPSAIDERSRDASPFAAGSEDAGLAANGSQAIGEREHEPDDQFPAGAFDRTAAS
jgi:hypothetical protein